MDEVCGDFSYRFLAAFPPPLSTAEMARMLASNGEGRAFA